MICTTILITLRITLMIGKNRLACYSLVCAICLIPTALRATRSTVGLEDWDKNFINGGGTSETPKVRFELTYVCFRQGHLTGEFQVNNQAEAAVQLDGVEKADGTFWPNVIIEVTNGNDQKEWRWQRIDQSVVTGKQTTLSVPARTVSQPLYVNMDEPKNAIGKATYGRVVFSNGRWSMFELEDLRRP